MKIGVFDSGYGGLTILNKISQALPEYEYLYLGDNARTPYGTRSFDVIYEYTLQAVRYLEKQGCRLIIIACNTASAKALRTIQQHDIDPDRLRVLGVIRPTVERVPYGCFTGSLRVPNGGSTVVQGDIKHPSHIGILATPGTVSSKSYVLELQKLNPDLVITQQACPMWVPLIEAGEHESDGADYFVHKYLNELFAKDPEIDTIILGCTHYPLLRKKIEQALANMSHPQPATCNPQPATCNLIEQGDIVAASLKDYLARHPEIEKDLTRHSEALPHHPESLCNCTFLTTESPEKFEGSASLFLSKPIVAQHIELA